LLAVLTLAVIASATEAQSAPLRTSVDTKGKYPVVRVAGEPVPWRLDSVAALRKPDGTAFSNVRSLLLDPRGGAWVVDNGEKLIHHFDELGQHVGIIGRTGSGPMEFNDPYSLAWTDDDLLLYDPGNSRIVRWTRSGRWVTQWTTMRMTGPAIRFYASGPGSAWLLQLGRRAGGKFAPEFVRFPPHGRGDTISQPERPGPAPGSVTCRTPDGGIKYFVSPFMPPHANNPTPDGQFIALDGSAYRLLFIRDGGDTVRAVERAVPRAPISNAEWIDETAEYRDFRRQVPQASCQGEQIRPASKPAADAIALDDRGRVWVERTGTDGVRWEVWEGERLIASVRGPKRDADFPVDIRGDRMAVVRSTDDGGQVVVVYRIVPH
jgi:hypothetical protein